ncbi:hypothetical protein AB0P17_37380 [Streptomyces sp. NPDC088124]|uniref:hypothetical protein n=1 Tax=Streptomyces sp. NPDC088124 TaxID=3154654 RepID=UPI003441ECD4
MSHLSGGDESGQAAELRADVGDDGRDDSGVPDGVRVVSGTVNDGGGDAVAGALDIMPIRARRFRPRSLGCTDDHGLVHASPRIDACSAAGLTCRRE